MPKTLYNLESLSGLSAAVFMPEVGPLCVRANLLYPSNKEDRRGRRRGRGRGWRRSSLLPAAADLFMKGINPPLLATDHAAVKMRARK